MKSYNLTAIAIIFFASVSSEGKAHYVYEYDTQIKGEHCAELRSEISHGKYNGGYYKSDVTLYYSRGLDGRSPCSKFWKRARGKIKVKQFHQKYDKKTQSWKTCTSTKGWNSNSKRNWRHSVKVRHNKRIPKCGSGVYRNLTHVKIDGVLFKLNSGKHTLPAK